MSLKPFPPALPDEAPETGARLRATWQARFRDVLSESWLYRIGLALAAVFVFLAAFGPTIAPYNPTRAVARSLLPPSGDHWWGTDAAGMDVFSRVISAARVDITVALAATGVSMALGSVLGLLAGFTRHRIGYLMARASDLTQAIPLFVLAMIYVTMAGRNTFNIITVVAILNVPIFFRLTRSQVITLRDAPFVEAARANGEREIMIALRQVFPNSLSPAFAQSSITMGWSIILTAGLSFVGAGIRPPTPEWGSMIASGANGIIVGDWWISVFPGVAMAIAVFGFAAVGELLQKTFISR